MFFPQIFFSLTTLIPYPVLFCLFRAPLGALVYFPVFLILFRFEYFLSQLSPFVAQIKNFFSDPVLLLLLLLFSDDICQGLDLLFPSLLVEGGDHWIHVCIFIIPGGGGEKYQLPAYHSLEFGIGTHWDLSAFRGQTWVLCVLACWFFADEGGRSSSASRGHFKCRLLLENFMFWEC